MLALFHKLLANKQFPFTIKGLKYFGGLSLGQRLRLSLR
jgi:hypothetical protein